MIPLNNLKPESFSVRDAKEECANKVCNFFRLYSEVSFCQWQKETETKALINRDNSVVLLAYSDANIVGALCGGLMGSRATVNHIAVTPVFRNQDVGSILFKYFEGVIVSKGVRRIFLFVDMNNIGGTSFWQAQGFSVVQNEVTLEKDISADILDEPLFR